MRLVKRLIEFRADLHISRYSDRRRQCMAKMPVPCRLMSRAETTCHDHWIKRRGINLSSHGRRDMSSFSAHLEYVLDCSEDWSCFIADDPEGAERPGKSQKDESGDGGHSARLQRTFGHGYMRMMDRISITQVQQSTRSHFCALDLARTSLSE